MKTALNLRDKSILCLDGGGIRGILTIQLLKKIEEICGKPCYEIFDAVAGTSTGGIIAGLIGFGKTAVEIEVLYEKFVNSVFTKRSEFSGRFLDLPKYSSANFFKDLEDEIGGGFFIEDCKLTTLITTKWMNRDKEIVWPQQSCSLIYAMLATMSAPTYFSPYNEIRPGRNDLYIDGGTTTHNNPSSIAITTLKYPLDQLTVFSLGTGYSPNPKLEYKDDILFWIEYIMNAAREDASRMQMDLLRSIPQLDFRRFQCLIPSTEMDDLTKFEQMKQIGADFAATLDFLTDPGECNP